MAISKRALARVMVSTVTLSLIGCGGDDVASTTSAASSGGAGGQGGGAGATSSSSSTGGAGGGGGEACMVGSQHAQFVLDHRKLSQTTSDYVFDLNGDGQPENVLGDFVAALAQQGVDSQVACDQAIAAGELLDLIGVSSNDPAFEDDACPAATWNAAQPLANPDFGGMGEFTKEVTDAGSTHPGVLSSGVFTSEPAPAQATTPVGKQLRLCIVGTISVPVVGVHLTLRPATAGLQLGQLNAAIRKQDVDAVLVPALAQNFTQRLQQDPNGPGGQTLAQAFDVGDGNGGPCNNPDDTQGLPGDGVVATCEVSGNPNVASLLAPDVDLFDANDQWAPSAANAAPDSLSVGFGFTGVHALF